VFLVGYVITSRSQALECSLPADIRRTDNVQEVIKNEHTEERKRQHQVLPARAHFVFSCHCSAETFTAESRLPCSRLD
jgi:hypothetical protein